MIISNLKGGLGNQLFQYAAGKALAEHHKVPLGLNLRNFNKDQRAFELDAFNVQFNIQNPDERFDFRPNILSRVIEKLKPAPKKRILKERSFSFYKDFFHLPSDVYLDGYWQSEKYFAPIKNIIRSEFTFKNKFNVEVEELCKSVKEINSVAIHIRQGDYNEESARQMHGILKVDYYFEAIAYLKKQISDPKFFIFSDSPVEYFANKTDEFTIVSQRMTSSHLEDFYLMSCCKHNIIANSSFSWWAAWLNTNPDKIVIAPKKWFNKGPKDTQDLYPPGWLQI